MKHTILIVDDQSDIRQLLAGILSDEGYETIAVESGEEALEKIESHGPHVVLLDVWLANPRFDGVYFLDLIKQKDPLLPVIMISGHGTVETAVSSLKKGAYDFIEKPFKTERLLATIERALEFSLLQKELHLLKEGLEKPTEIVGISSESVALRQTVDRVARTNGRILIEGPLGAGKQSLAYLIHEKSIRKGKPFVVVSCMGLSSELFDRKFLGSSTALGILETAAEGTIYLDGLQDLSKDVQLKFMNILREGKFSRKEGGMAPLEVRFICGSNLNLEDQVKAGEFHQDLFYRLNVIPLKISSLSHRCEDIPLLADSMMTRLVESRGCKEKEFTPEAKLVLQSYDWPGNVRQLRNVMEWVYITYPQETQITGQMLPAEIRLENQETISQVFNKEWILSLELKDAREKFEKVYLGLHMRRFNGNISKTSRSVGMDRTALHRKIRQLGLVADEPLLEMVEAD
ncbi:MAG: sigma-54-dependent transcriptional regulator [Alphaproteobacteria bacterium]